VSRADDNDKSLPKTLDERDFLKIFTELKAAGQAN
jgi:hypothetical protein